MEFSKSLSAGLLLVSYAGTVLAQSPDLCEGNTYRCHQWANCAIDGVSQPCAYASSSAVTGALIFADRFYSIDWMDADAAKIRLNSEVGKAENATVTEDATGVRLTFGNANTLFVPASPERQ